MFKNIKNWVITWIAFSLTTIIVWFTYAAVTTVSTWDSLTASMWNSMTGNYSYSTSEVDTGKKWIDWKPIYRKVLELWTITQESTYRWRAISHWILDIDRIIIGHINSWEEWLILGGNSYRNTSSEFRFTIDSLNFNYAYWSNSTTTSYENLVIILEYTKTTD